MIAMIVTTARTSSRENPLSRSMSSPFAGRGSRFACDQRFATRDPRKVGPPRRRPRAGGLMGRVEVGLGSLRGPRLARAADLRGQSGLPFDRDVGAETFETLVAEAFDLHQIGRLLEGAMLLPVVDDALCGPGADAREQRELRDVRSVDVHHTARCRTV